MIVVLHDIPQQCGRGVYIVDHDIDAAVVEKVSESRATSRDDIGQAAAGGGGYLAKPGSIQITKQLRALCPSCAPVLPIDAGINVAVGDEDISQAIVVEVNPVPQARNGMAGSARPD